jgi:hypothetical protein
MKTNKILMLFSVSVLSAGASFAAVESYQQQNQQVQYQNPYGKTQNQYQNPALNQNQNQNVAAQPQNRALTPEMIKQQKDIDTSDKYAMEWLAIVDKGDFNTAYGMATKALQLTIPQNEWVTMMQVMKGSLGQVTERKVIDIRTAKDPAGAPQGDYMIFVYETTFSSGKKATEIISLQEYNGVWRVYSYTLSGQTITK